MPCWKSIRGTETVIPGGETRTNKIKTYGPQARKDFDKYFKLGNKPELA
jgi:hypothetical protein